MYNGLGNIESVTTTPTSGTATTTTFTYGDTAHPDRLTAYNGKPISYNSIGCVTSYDGRSYTWRRGKLGGITRGSSTQAGTLYENFTASYDALGRRVSKNYVYDQNPASTSDYSYTYNTKYTYDNSGRLIRELITERFTYAGGTATTKELTYLYDESGIIGCVYSVGGGTPTTYYFQRNLLGDVVGIYNTSGTKIAEYAYDAFGNCSIIYGYGNDITRVNPIRYRGYYLDRETNLYYLNSRYYNPEWRRFISPDDSSYLNPENVNGLNVYCYCNNDPVNFVDPSGHFPVLAVILGITAVVGFGLSVGGVAADDNFLTAIGLTMVAIPALIAGGLAAFASTGALAVGIGIATMIAGGFTGVFAGAEYQEAFTGQNFILNMGISDELYNGLMLTTAGIATIGTFASSFVYNFNIHSIDKIGTLEGTNYKGIRFTQKVQRAGGRQVKLYRTLEWHTHSHLGYNPHWQMNKFSYYNEMWNRSDAIARWTWWLTQIVG